jgi:hypothetical protein
MTYAHVLFEKSSAPLARLAGRLRQAGAAAEANLLSMHMVRAMKSIFKREAEPTPVTGVELLRAALKARNKTPLTLTMIIDGGSTSRDEHQGRIPGMSPGKLDDFIAGKADLNTEQLKALTKQLFPYREYDAETGLLQSANKTPPAVLGVVPGPYVHPNPRIAKATADYIAALAEERR